MNRGVALMGQYDYEGAVQAFEQALAAAPQRQEIKVNLAIARFNRGKKENQDIEQARSLLDAVLEQDPANARAWYFKGIILQHLGQAEAAVGCLDKVLALRPDDGVAWYVLGVCKQRLGQDSQKELQRALELRPYLVSAYYRLWQTLQAAGEPQRAAPYLERFKQLRDSSLAETIELPQYNQMGDLALALPLTDAPHPAREPAVYRAGQAKVLVTRAASAPAPASRPFGSAAIFARARDGQPDIVFGGSTSAAGQPGFLLRASGKDPTFAPAPASAGLGLDAAEAPLAFASGDYDNDEIPDLFVVGEQSNRLFHGTADGAFTEAAGVIAAPSAGGRTRSALWIDADHDGDLDLYVCNAGAPNQLFNNNADGTFKEIAVEAGAAVPEGDSVLALAGDIDGDRDTDLIVLRAGAPAKILLNELTGKFREAASGSEIHGDLGGVLQDFTGDGLPDLLVLGGSPAALKLFVGDGHGQFKPGAELPDTGETPRGIRVADADLDGDLDGAVFGREGHLLLNDGTGHFTLQARVWTASPGAEIAGAELADLTGDLVPDLLLLERGQTDQVKLVPGSLSPSTTALALSPTGVRSRDKRTRSPASGYGVTLTVRAGSHEQVRLFTGQTGGFSQSPLPAVFGLGGAARADYVRLGWSDAVAQIERALPAGSVHPIAETQRKISSCPVLFTWNGSRFEFITDFAGVGGLGYFIAPGEYAAAQPVDYVKIAPEQLQPRNGRYEVRITEPMEEASYVDRLELLAIDHPAAWQAFPDERLAVAGPPPTHELLVVQHPLFPQHAVNPAGEECAAALRAVDRHYAFEPALDRRFFGFCQRHSLTLDFGQQAASVGPGERVYLFINGYLEYPYSQTTYAAGQAGVAWEPIRIERRQPNGEWRTVVPDAGALGGMSRTMTVDLTGLVGGGSCELRLTSNLEIYYDQIFLGVAAASDRVQVHRLPVDTANLQYLGFPREASPDGREPLIYDYAQIEPDAPFQVLSGAYTRYGDVKELLTDFDDEYVLLAPGDEIAATFDATRLPPLASGMTRSFVLVSHAYCKDMDLYTATPQTLAPMPFRGMSRYPYPATERYPDTPRHRQLQGVYNTRLVE